MKKLTNTVILVLVIGLAYAAAMISAGGGPRGPVVPAPDYAACNYAGSAEKTADIHDFHGFIAFNALNGTSERIDATDRQVVVCRNSFQNCGYNSAASKRQVSHGFRSLFENAVNQYFLSKLHLYADNCNVLAGGFQSSTERLHLFRILIV